MGRTLRFEVSVPRQALDLCQAERRPRGVLDTKEGSVVLHGSVGYNQDVWTGRFDQPDSDADFPLKGHFRLEARGGNLLTGSYQPDGTTLPFRMSGTR